MPYQVSTTTDLLLRSEARHQRALERYEEARAYRDAAIRAYIADGHTHADAHRLLKGKLTRSRIGQIALDVKPASPPPAA